MELNTNAYAGIQSTEGNPRSTSSLQLSLIGLTYFALLSMAYSLEIGGKWQARGFESEFSPGYLALSTMFVFAFFYQQGAVSNFRTLLLTFAFLTIYIPAMVYLSFGNPSSRLGLVYLLSILPLIFFSRLRFPTFLAKSFSKSAFITFLVAYMAIFLFLLASRVGFGNINLDIYAVYDFRHDAAENIGVQLNRNLSLISKFFLPLLLIYAASTQGKLQVLLVSVAVFFTFFLFAYWQHKSALILPLAVLGLYFFLRCGSANRRLLLLFLLFSFVLFAEAALYSIQGLSQPGALNSLFGRRALYIPPLLADYYLDFFSQNEKIYWHGLTQHLGIAGPGYKAAPAFLIGAHYFDSESVSANVGFIGSGYANAGIWGVLVYSSFLGLAVAFVSAQAKRIGSVFLFCLTAFVFHTAFASSDLITTIRSHGMLLMLLTIPFLKKLT